MLDEIVPVLSDDVAPAEGVAELCRRSWSLYSTSCDWFYHPWITLCLYFDLRLANDSTKGHRPCT